MTRGAALGDLFERLEIDPASFGHREHLQAAYELLLKYPFVEATARYADTIHAMARAAGAAEKFNVTITLAFISLLAERMETSTAPGFDTFLDENPDLSKNTLQNWYSPERLSSELSRRIFLLPDRVAPATGG